MQSETAVLRRELHKVHKVCDASRAETQCLRQELESVKADLAVERSKRKRAEESEEKVQQQCRGHLEKIRVLENMLEEKGIPLDADRLAGDALRREKEARAEAEAELKKERAKNRRVSNENTPPSAGSDAQGLLKKYREENKENYHPLDEREDEDRAKGRGARKGRGKRHKSRNLLRSLFGRKTKKGSWSRPRSSPSDARKRTMEEIEPTHELDCTVSDCPVCGAKADVKTIVLNVVDIPGEVTTAGAASNADVRHAYDVSISWDSQDLSASEDSVPQRPPEAAGAAQPVQSEAAGAAQPVQSEAAGAAQPVQSEAAGAAPPPPHPQSQEPGNKAGTGPAVQTAEAAGPTDAVPGAGGKAAISDTLGIRPAEKTRVRVSVGKCSNGHKIDTTPKGITRGSIFGPKLMTLMVFMFGLTLSLGSIQSMLVMHGIESVSRTTIMKALSLVAAQKFASKAAYISKRLGDSQFLMADETKFKMGKKYGYVWAFIGAYGIKIHVDRSRSRAVVDLHFPHFEIPIVVDGYAVYKSFKIRQRCWAHVLREAELLAATHRGKLAELHQSLQSILHAAKQLPSDTTDDQLQGWIDNVKDIAAVYTELGHDFGVTLHNAAPDLFTFVKYPCMPPTNNMSERTLRPVVLHKKIRQTFRSIVGMQTYSTLMTCLLTWKSQDKDQLEKIYETIMSS